MSDYEDDATTLAHSALARTPRAQPFAIAVTSGPDEGKTWAIEPTHPSRLLVGKGPTSDLVLTDKRVSRRHAALEIAENELRITDLDSTNGTFVNGLRVGDAFLRGGETVRLGDSDLSVTRPGEPVPLALPELRRFGRVLGASTAMKRLYPLCERLAQTTVPLVVEGETGTGKEQLARALHEEGSRAAHPFVVFDCTAVAANLIESELFGHEKGAFTGAGAIHRGVFERAHEGTLLIDEIGDMPLSLQPKLLRVIEQLEVTRVGGTGPIRVDVRLMAATRRDLEREVQRGRFRDDLFHRLAVARIELPPLRQRKGDVQQLAKHFWQEFGGDSATLTDDVLRRWMDDAWPGNVRELRNAVARRVALGDLGDIGQPASRRVGPAIFGRDTIGAVLTEELSLAEARQRVIDELERRFILETLDRAGGNVTRAAGLAGVARRHFHRLLAKHDQRD